MVNQSLKALRIAIPHTLPEFKTDQIRGWIQQCSGRLTKEITPETTHVILSEKTWKARNEPNSLVSSILKRRVNGHKIHMMKCYWIRECCDKKRHLGENNREYSWEVEERGVKGKGAKEAKSTQGLMKQVYEEYTEEFVDEREVKRIEARKKAEKEAEETRKQEFVNQRNALRRREVAAVFRKGAQKARNELLSDNHHIYTDSTAFVYDVTVTKVDTRKNRNERYSLTIYESNGDFPTYAVNCQFAKTGERATNNVICALGSNLPTALRAFKKVFKEKTGVEWDNRVAAAIERNNRPRSLGVKEPGIDKAELDRLSDLEFQRAPFEYHPPLYGPRGEMPEQSVPPAQEAGDFVSGEQTEDGFVMSGANGEGPQEDESNDLSSAEYEKRMAELERAGKELDGQEYEEPHSFGKDQYAEEEAEFAEEGGEDHLKQEMRSSPYQGEQIEEFSTQQQSQNPIDTEYFDHTQMAEHAQGQFLGMLDQQEGEKKRKQSEGSDEDLPFKKARMFGDQDDFAGEYTLDFNSFGDDITPRGMGDEETQFEPANFDVDFGFGGETTQTF